jgi:acyl-CoA reductase-like NAD-dependent aldehyde dehydrogenase
MSDKENQDKQRSKLPLAGLLGAAAVGAVYLYGKNKERVQQRLRGWMLKIKGEVMEQVAKAESLTREDYEAIVDDAVDKYKDKKNKAAEQFEQTRQQLKAQWEEIHEEIERHTESAQGEVGDSIRSAISAAIAGAADEIIKKHDADMDTLDLLKKAIGSGADDAKQEITKMITESSDTSRKHDGSTTDRS